MLRFLAPVCAATLLPLAFAQTPVRSFEVATVQPEAAGSRGGFPYSIDPKHFAGSGVLVNFIRLAYGIREVEGGPNWIQTARFTIKAATEQAADENEFRLMLRQLLAERFGLKMSDHPRKEDVLQLVVAKGGPLFHPLAAGERPNRVEDTDNKVTETFASVSGLLEYLNEGFVGQPVVDKTGLTGRYDISLTWPVVTDDYGHRARDYAATTYLLTKELGLMLVSGQGMIDHWSVEAATMPR